jgi:uncharacterized protein YjbI with pentapeptide repeats
MLNSESIGNKIAAARKKLNLSQAELAQQVSISSQAVGKWERGESMPDITMLNRLAEILGVDLNYFSDKFQSVGGALTDNEEKVVKEQEADFSLVSSGGKPLAQGKKLSWNMSQGNWLDADFSGLKNLQEKFRSSNMKNCKFVGSELSGLLLKSNNIEGCDFSKSNISYSQIQSSNLGDNIFKGCSLKGTEFSENNIGGCDFTEADFTEAEFRYSNLSKNVFSNAVWHRTKFTGVKIDDAIFEGTIEDCYFEICAFFKVTFQNAVLINTFFKNNRNLKRIKFIDCKTDRMTYEFLKSGKADLSNVSLL